MGRGEAETAPFKPTEGLNRPPVIAGGRRDKGIGKLYKRYIAESLIEDHGQRHEACSDRVTADAEAPKSGADPSTRSARSG